MYLVFEENDYDPKALQKLLQDHGYTVSLRSGVVPDADARSETAEEDLPLAFLEHFVDGILLVDVETVGVKYTNKAFADMLGYSLDEINTHQIWDWDVVRSREEIEQMYATRNWPGEHFETRLRRKNGQVLDVAISHTPTTWRGAEVVFCAVEDISERKKTERFLQHAQFTLEKARDQVFWTDAQGNFYFVNEAACASLGYSREELLAMSVLDIDPDVTFSGFQESWQQLQKRGALILERRHRDKDGRIYPVEIRANLLVFDGQEYYCAFATDIRERKKREKVLRLSQFAMDNTADQAFWITPAGQIMYANQAACASLGYNREELVGMSLSDIDPDCPAEKVIETWESLKTDKSRRFECYHKAKDGRVYPVEIRSNYTNFDGQEFRFAFATDISERKAAEEAFKRSEERYRQLMEMLPIAAYTTDAEGRITFFNRKAKELWQREPLLDTDRWCGSFKLRYSDGQPMAHDSCPMARTVKAGEACQGHEIMVENPDGSFSYALAYPALLGGVKDSAEGAVNLLFDITERKKAEQELRQANLVLENSPAVLYRCKAQPGWPMEMVTRNVTCFGYTPEDLLSGAVSFAELIHPEDLDRVAAELTEYSLRGDDRFQQEYRIITREGDVRWVDDRTVAERDGKGRVTHYQGIVLDITDRKRTELVMTARMRLIQFADTHTLDELLEATLDEAEELTGSQIGFFVFLDAEQKTLSMQNWSTRTKRDFCTAQGKGLHYPVSQAGVWADCIHQRRPVIHNDYASLPHRKGLPPGHSPLIRELVVPVFRGDNIVAIVAVGNKPQGYTQQDVDTVSFLADLSWTIAERKLAEEARRKSECKYRSIVENAPFGITRSSREGKLLNVNPALASILKYDSVQELMETVNRSSIQDVFFPKPEERDALVDKIFTQDSWYVFNNRLRCKDGSIVTCRVHSRRLADGDAQFGEFESYQENITEQLAAEEALRESEEKFRVVAETSPVAICLYQEDRHIYANPAMERLFGYCAEELLNMSLWDIVHDDCQDLVRERGLARLAGQSVPGQYEIKYLTKAGGEGYVLISAGMMEYQGLPTGVASFLDITERKRTEQLIRASLKEKEVLLREIHHRVKNNLQVVSSLLFLQSQKFSDPELQNCFLESQSRICSMAIAHEQLYQSKNLADISIKAYLENLVQQQQQIFVSPGQEIDCRLAVEDIPLDIEKVVPCGLLITELLSNAYKHAFADGRSGQVAISLHSDAGQFELTVADDGVGVPADFDYCSPKTLGLQLVTALVNQLNGTLEVESRSGTCFRVQFAG